MKTRKLPFALFALTAAAFPAPPAMGQALPYTFSGSASSDQTGFSVAGAGDLNGDGVVDLLVGTPYSSDGALLGGKVQAFSGETGAVLHTWLGMAASQYLGWSVSGAGDYDNDGFDDVVIGSPGLSPGGEMRVYSGATGLLIVARPGASGEAQGRAVGGGLDVNLDGWDDAIVGAVGGNGKVRVYTGSASSLSGVLYTWFGDAPGDFFGHAVAAAGDLDGDGYGDVVVGAWGSDVNGSGAGMVRAFSGRTGASPLVWTWYGDDVADSLGESVAGAGDVDGDGFGDVIAGAPYYEVGGSARGLARIWSGRTGLPIRTLYGDPDWTNFGTGVAGLGDLDGDGQAEVAVSSPSSSGAFTYGAVRVFSGATGAPLTTLYGDPLDAFGFGRSLAHAGDLNADGKGDLIVGAYEDSVYTGAARAFLLGCDAPSIYCTAKANSLGCLPAISHAGAASLAIADNFVLAASNVRNNKNGIFFWGLAPAAIPFGGGTLCVAPPVVRTPVQASGGAPPPANDCSGSYAYHFSQAYMAAEGLTAGTAVHGQFWSRDPDFAPPNNVGLTDAVSFDVCP